MKLSDFDYNLPQELIAQHPLSERDSSRLLVLDRKTGKVEHRIFTDLPLYLEEKDLVVLNDTRVCNARLIGKRVGLEGKVEVLLSERLGDDLYAGLCKPFRKLKQGTRLIFDKGTLEAEVVGEDKPFKLLRLLANGNLSKILEEIGDVPLPPYIKRAPTQDDKERYQTVFAKNTGAIAAPTAGLHFTESLIKNLKAKGVGVTYITLHVGYATFKPVTEADVTKHRMHKEYFEISNETAERINRTKNNGGRVIAVGTTVCRAIEAAVFQKDDKSKIRDANKWTDIFIYPGYRFKLIDVLLTNFHLPKTTLLMLVAAFAGKENVLKAYQEAMGNRYRFYSYGDAMLII